VGNRRTLHKPKSVSYNLILNIFSLSVKTLQMGSFLMKEMKFLIVALPSNYSHGQGDGLYTGKVFPTL
jgi:hypothetical protein